MAFVARMCIHVHACHLFTVTTIRPIVPIYLFSTFHVFSALWPAHKHVHCTCTCCMYCNMIWWNNSAFHSMYFSVWTAYTFTHTATCTLVHVAVWVMHACRKAVIHTCIRTYVMYSVVNWFWERCTLPCSVDIDVLFIRTYGVRSYDPHETWDYESL